MRTYSKYILLSALSFNTIHTYADPIDQSGLLYSGKPIDPLCFSSMENSNTIKLNECGIKKEKYTITDKNKDLLEKGYIGYNWKDTNDSYTSEGSSYYKSFVADNNQYWIYTINNTGGSGEFTAINLVKRKDTNTLLVNSIAGGDRCNGGIQDVKKVGNLLNYNVNLTPFDILDLSGQNPHNLKAYDDLASCAACCAGTATYELDTTSSPKLKSVSLDSTKPDEMNTQGRYQQCFNSLHAKYIKDNKTQLNDSELKIFAKEFNEKCVH